MLGGTSDARQLAEALHERGVEVIYSIAGLLRQPRLECRVISGGFSAQGGMQAFIEREQVDAILDATHPYAQTISETALGVARARDIPAWRYLRPAWEASEDDDWRGFDDWAELHSLLRDRRSVFLASGQPVQAYIDALGMPGKYREQRQYLRSARRPEITLPASMTWIEDVGPFGLDSERALFERYRFDALVCKNSGGSATDAKLSVARERGIPVYMFQRPCLPAVDIEFQTLDQCLEHVVDRAREIA